jgi:D-glycero-D-manno-heptose 1,7-bisphosphate phosphatase
VARAAFFDRDGTIIRDVGYANNPDDVVLLDGVVPVLQELMLRDYKIVVVTNQSGLGSWRITKAQFDAVQRRMLFLLSAYGVVVEKTYFCPHTPAMSCECRKPKCGMFYRAATELNIDLERSIMFGDKESDMVDCVGHCVRVPKNGAWGVFWPLPTLPLAPRVKTRLAAF